MAIVGDIEHELARLREKESGDDAPVLRTSTMTHLVWAPLRWLPRARSTLAGLQDWAAARGVPQARTQQCLTDQKKIDQLVQISSDVTNQYPDFQGTPSFIINGSLLKDTATWDKLQPQLDAALK